ncbi:MAG: phage holin family protein [Candidatus Woesearchaeota archaeon]|jgi:hypothetical protein|nr:phage holin family protein [Candidatus Woesearchaeota archaeon]
MNKHKNFKKKSSLSTRRKEKDTDLGDFAKKIMQGIVMTHKAGGGGLVVMAIGSVGFLFLFLLGSSMENRTFYSLLFVSIILLLIGVYIKISEKNNS